MMRCHSQAMKNVTGTLVCFMKVKTSGPYPIGGKWVFMGDSVVLFLILCLFFVQFFVLRRLRTLFVVDSQIPLMEPHGCCTCPWQVPGELTSVYAAYSGQ